MCVVIDLNPRSLKFYQIEKKGLKNNKEFNEFQVLIINQ